MPRNKRIFYKKAPYDRVWWVDNMENFGIHEFSFDRKTVFNLFADYPQKLTKAQKDIFDAENPHWASFFAQ